MPEFFKGLLCISLMVVILVASRRAARRDLKEVEADFASQKFTVDEATVLGRDIKVVKRVIEHAHSEHGSRVNTIFFYGVVPGNKPSYFLTICHCETVGWTMLGWPKTSWRWLVRPLTAERMRGALVGDDVALRAAFGDVVADTLHA